MSDSVTPAFKPCPKCDEGMVLYGHITVPLLAYYHPNTDRQMIFGWSAPSEPAELEGDVKESSFVAEQWLCDECTVIENIAST